MTHLNFMALEIPISLLLERQLISVLKLKFPLEIEQARKELDERSFRQEYEASFEAVHLLSLRRALFE